MNTRFSVYIFILRAPWASACFGVSAVLVARTGVRELE
jgi:hypothetical protein